MKKELWWIAGLLAVVTALFFYQTILFGKVPFPGDGLMSDFQPWRSTSYMGYAAGGVPSKAQYPDVYRQLYPWKTLAVSQLRQGKLPLWNPYNFSGTPLLANFQSAALYPLGILYLLMSQIAAWTTLVALQPFLAALFTYLYMKRIGAKPYGAILAAISYGFSGFMAVWLEYNTVGHVILWLPLMVLAIESLRQKPKPGWFVILALSNTAALLAGHPQVYAYEAVFALIYAFVRLPKTSWVPGMTFFLLGIGIAGIQLIPGMELIAFAARSPHEFSNVFTKILIQPWQVIAVAFPNIFGNPATRTYWPADTFVGKVTTIGLVPLFFFLSAVRRKDIVTRWHIYAAAAVAILITANPVSFLLYQVPIPLISSSSPTLMAFLLAFSLSVSCGLGLDYWMTDRHSVKKLIIRSAEVGLLFFVLLLAVMLPVFPSFHEHASVALRAIAYGGLVTAATLILFGIAVVFPNMRRYAVIALILLQTLDVFVFFVRFNPFVPVQFVFPNQQILTFLKHTSPDRYWGYGTAGISANFATQYQLFSPEGYDPLYPKWYGQFLYSYRTGKPMETFDNATRSDAAISSGFGDGGLSDPNKQTVLNALSVRYILDRTENGSTEKTFPPDIFTLAYSFEDWRVYENTHALPRAYISPESAKGTATILSYEPERIVIQTNASAASDLIVTDTYYPGWHAAIDGAPVTISRYDLALRRVAIPKGTHTVIMTYAPFTVAAGEVLSMISSVGLVLGFVRMRKKSV